MEEEGSMSFKSVYILRQLSRWLFIINDANIQNKKINRFLVTFARVHLLDICSQRILDRQWMPEWPLSVTTTFLVPSRKQVFSHLEWTFSKYESKRTESKWPKSQWKSPNGSEHPPVLLDKTPLTAADAKSFQSCPTLCDPIDGSPPGSSFLGFSRQEHWSGLPFPSPMHGSAKGK